MSTQNNQSFVPLNGTAGLPIPGMVQAQIQGLQNQPAVQQQPQVQPQAPVVQQPAATTGNNNGGIPTMSVSKFQNILNNVMTRKADNKLLYTTSTSKICLYDMVRFPDFVAALAKENSATILSLTASIHEAVAAGLLVLDAATECTLARCEKIYDAEELKASYVKDALAISAQIEEFSNQKTFCNVNLFKLQLSFQENLLNTIQEKVRGTVTVLVRVLHGSASETALSENRIIDTAIVTDLLNVCPRKENSVISDYRRIDVSTAAKSSLTPAGQREVLNRLKCEAQILTELSLHSNNVEKVYDTYFNTRKGNEVSKYDFNQSLVVSKTQNTGSAPTTKVSGYEDWNGARYKDSANGSDLSPEALTRVSEDASNISAQGHATVVAFILDVGFNKATASRRILPAITDSEWSATTVFIQSLIKRGLFRKITSNSKQICFASSCFMELAYLPGNTPDLFIASDENLQVSCRIRSVALSPAGIVALTPDWYAANEKAIARLSASDWNNKSISEEDIQILKFVQNSIEDVVNGVTSSAASNNAKAKKDPATTAQNNKSRLFGF